MFITLVKSLKDAVQFLFTEPQGKSYDYRRLTVVEKIKLCKYRQRDLVESLNRRNYATVRID